MLNRASLVVLTLATLLAGCHSPTPPAAKAPVQAVSNPLIGTWRCSTDGSKLIQNADGTGEWIPVEGTPAAGYHFKWTSDGQALLLTTERTPQPTPFRYSIDAAGALKMTGPDGMAVTYEREPGTAANGTAEAPQRTANRGEGPRMWADEQIEQNHQELTRSAPQQTDTPDAVQKKVEKLKAAAAEIRASASSGFPDRRAQYEKYATELEALAQDWANRLQASGLTGGGAASPTPSAAGTAPTSSDFGAPPR